MGSRRRTREDQPPRSVYRLRSRGLEPADLLRQSAAFGGLTLVLGAGVSLGHGIPTWQTLADRVWENAFGKARDRNDASGCSLVGAGPQQLPIQFELAAEQLASAKSGRRSLVDVLREELYVGASLGDADVLRDSDDTLPTIARALVAEHARGGGRRIRRVITLNVDDLLETAIHRLQARGQRAFKAIARPTMRPEPGTGDEPIPIYHVHGFVPGFERGPRGGRPAWARDGAFDHMLVFTDEQYWATTAEPHSFENRIVTSALADGQCVFVGLSMTDVNILRWLALRRIEVVRDLAARGKHNARVRPRLDQHFWIRPERDDPDGLLSRFLRRRGVRAVPIESWGGRAFRDLLDACLSA